MKAGGKTKTLGEVCDIDQRTDYIGEATCAGRTCDPVLRG